MLDIDFNDAVLPSAGTLVLLVAEDGERPALYDQADAATGGAISRAVEAGEFGFGRAKSCVVLGPGAGLARIVLVGLGKSADLDAQAMEAAGGAAYQAAKAGAVAAVAVGALPAALAAHAALGAVLSSYRFDLYRTRQKPDERPKLARLAVLSEQAEAARAAWPALRAIAQGTFIARDLVSEPANTLTPPVFADRIADLASLGLEIEIFEPERMRELGFGALLGVAIGSDAQRSPRRHHALARPARRRSRHAAPIAFIGKGVTFDSGGISIKPAGGMEDMKWDMAGAGTVTGLMATLAGRKARGSTPSASSAWSKTCPPARAQRPSDVMHLRLRPDGRNASTPTPKAGMVLADVLWYAQDRFKPKFADRPGHPHRRHHRRPGPRTRRPVQQQRRTRRPASLQAGTRRRQGAPLAHADGRALRQAAANPTSPT